MSRPGFWGGPLWVGLVAGVLALAAATQATRWVRATVDFDAISVGQMKIYFDREKGFSEAEVAARKFSAGKCHRTPQVRARMMRGVTHTACG
jgi:hypothetical protein